MNDQDTRLNVREFYDQVGWMQVEDGVFQNARYEDLRPVSQEYIHRCHLRVGRHLRAEGKYFLDAGSGPIQYPEYLEYSKGYEYRVCADISHVALQSAREKVGRGGLYVVADVSRLPFKVGVFDGLVSLHTIHHLPQVEHTRAYLELNRVLSSDRVGVVVNGWSHSPLMNFFRKIIRFRKKLWLLGRRLLGRKPPPTRSRVNKADDLENPRGTFVEKHDPAWLKREVAPLINLKILVWRSVSVRFLRNFIPDNWIGTQLLRLIFWLEERFPSYFGEKGSYPLVVFRKI